MRFHKKTNIKTFTDEIKNGTYFMCAVCNRCLYRKLVLCFHEKKYNITLNLLIFVAIMDVNIFEKRVTVN